MSSPKKKRLRPTQTEIGAYMKDLEGIDRLDLLTLKAQILIDDRLRHALAARLRTDEESVRDLTINTPIQVMLGLTLAEPMFSTMKKALFALNETRKRVAHHVQVNEFESLLQKFLEIGTLVNLTTFEKDDDTASKVRKLTATFSLLLDILADEFRDGEFFVDAESLSRTLITGSECTKHFEEDRKLYSREANEGHVVSVTPNEAPS